MNLSQFYNQVAGVEKDIADIQKKIADETKKELDKQKQIDSVQRSITRSTSPSSLQSKTQQIRGYQSDIVRIHANKASLQKKLSDKTKELSVKKQNLAKEEEKERQRIQKEQKDLQKAFQNDLSQQRELMDSFLQNQYSSVTSILARPAQIKSFDFFISHATEDKEEFVKPFAAALVEAGFKVWYDEFQLTVGDSLRRKIDEGLKSSRFGIVVLSSDFFKKNWPQYELDGLMAREMNGIKIILPIWHKVTIDEVLSYSPTLADKIAFNTAIHSTAKIVSDLKNLFTHNS